MQRREFLVGALSLPLAGCRDAARRTAADGGLTIAGIWSQSGPFANIGVPINWGCEFAVQAYGSVLGRKLSYVLQDDRSEAGQAIRKARELAGEREVKYLVGGTSSPIALAMGRQVFASRGVYVSVAGADEITGTKCNRSMFRWPPGAYCAANATIRPFLDSFPDAKRWYTITAQSVFGESMLQNCRAVLQEKGVEHVGNSYHAMADREFSGLISSALSQKPDVIALCNFGSATVDLVRQVASFGAKSRCKIVVIWSTGLDQFVALGPDICDGIYFGANYWHTIDTPGNRVLRDAALRNGRIAPSYLEACGFASVQLIVEAIGAAKSTEPDAVIAAMEGMKYAGVTGEETVRAGDHQVLKDYLLIRGKPRSAMTDDADFAEIVSASRYYMPVEQTGCVLDRA